MGGGIDFSAFKTEPTNTTAVGATTTPGDNPFAAMVAPTGDGGFKPSFSEFKPQVKDEFPDIGEVTQGFGAQKSKKEREAEQAAKIKKQ